MYEIGRVYVWQNLPPSPHSEVQNGSECTVVGPPKYMENKAREWVVGQPTDSFDGGDRMWALAGNLRPKNPPTGEKKIRSMFEPKPVMEVA